jgi:hypothetical protein
MSGYGTDRRFAAVYHSVSWQGVQQKKSERCSFDAPGTDRAAAGR